MNRTMRTVCRPALACLLLACLLLSGCDIPQSMLTSGILSPEESYDKAVASEFQVQDAADLYTQDMTRGVEVVYLAVAPGNAADGTNHTWEDIHSMPLDEQGDEPFACEGVFQLGDEDAPTPGSFGYGLLTANCTVRLQGLNASTRQQKSYRVTIKDGMGSLDGMKTLVLAKHFSDPLRFTNMLYYQLTQQLPALLSTRTRLVHLYVKDTAQGPDTLYQDYGLYTMVEPINKTYFKNRHLDGDGALYKANNFDFARHEDVLVLATSPRYDAAAFDALLESKGDPDHTRLLAMLEAVNDPDIPITQVVSTYFDPDNLYSFLALQLLTANRDASTQNYHLYSPTGSQRFYFIAWDNDGALRDDYNELRAPGQSPAWDMGVFSFYDNVLFVRLFQDAQCLSALSTAVDTLYEQYLTEEAVSAQAARLAELVKPYLYALPDRTFARVTSQQYDTLVAQLGEQITRNYDRYYESLDKPAPFHIHEPEIVQGQGLLLSWDTAACSQSVTYTIQLDDSWDFQTPLLSGRERTETQWLIDSLPAGQYFLRVTAHTADGQSQIAYETYATEVKTTLHGVLCFYVLSDGSVHASYFDGGD
ncbi:MAG: CotH kinase family protein [Aristaeellaceae bacterium]